MLSLLLQPKKEKRNNKTNNFIQRFVGSVFFSVTIYLTSSPGLKFVYKLADSPGWAFSKGATSQYS